MSNENDYQQQKRLIEDCKDLINETRLQRALNSSPLGYGLENARDSFDLTAAHKEREKCLQVVMQVVNECKQKGMIEGFEVAMKIKLCIEARGRVF